MDTFLWCGALIVVVGVVFWLLRYLDGVDKKPVETEPTYPERVGLAAVKHELSKPPAKQPKKRPTKKAAKKTAKRKRPF